MPKRFSRGWLLTCTLACINALPLSQQKSVANYGLSSKIGDLSSAATNDYDFEDFYPDKYVDKIDKTRIELSDLNAGLSTTTVRNNDNYVIMSRILEPDAEMLPAHYTGVKPPGVDHMEIRIMDSSSVGTNRKNNLVDRPKSGELKSADGAVLAEIVEASRSAEGEKGFRKNGSFDTSSKGEKLKIREKGKYADAAGKKNSHEETEKHFKAREDESKGAKSEDYDIVGQRDKGHNSAGYHNVYHKDEYKKDADFYDNDRQGGRFHKHGHYDEKHSSAEGNFQNGDSEKSAFAEAEASKNGEFEKERKNNEASGHDGKSGYVGFFGKLDEFAKNIGSSVGRAFGKSEVATKV